MSAPHETWKVRAKRELLETALIVIAAQGNRVKTTLQLNDG